MISNELQSHKDRMQKLVAAFTAETGDMSPQRVEKFMTNFNKIIEELEEEFPKEKEDIRKMENELIQEMEPFLASLDTYRAENPNIPAAEGNPTTANNAATTMNDDLNPLPTTSGAIRYVVGSLRVDEPTITSENRDQIPHHSGLSYQDLSRDNTVTRSSEGINLRNADLRGVKFGPITYAKFDGADLRAADLTKVDFTKNYIQYMIIDDSTKMTDAQKELMKMDELRSTVDDRRTRVVENSAENSNRPAARGNPTTANNAATTMNNDRSPLPTTRGPIRYVVGSLRVNNSTITSENRDQIPHPSGLDYEELSMVQDGVRASKEINLRNADLRGVVFEAVTRANFDGADLRGADLTKVDFSKNDMKYMIIDDSTKMTDAQKELMKGDELRSTVDDRRTRIRENSASANPPASGLRLSSAPLSSSELNASERGQ